MNQNHRNIRLAEIVSLQTDLDDVMSAVVHSILFSRVLGLVVPGEGHVQSLDVYYPVVNDTALLRNVSASVMNFCKHIQRPDAERRGVLRVKFFEQREKAGWFSKTIENICWEEWYLPVRLAGDAGNNKVAEVRTKTAAQLEACLNQIVEAANDPRPYFPKLVSKDMVPFPYTVEVVPPNDNELLNFWSIIAATK